MLNEKGIPTPLVHVMMAPPKSRMDVLMDNEIQKIERASKIADKYNEEVDSHSAYEILNAKLELAQQKTEAAKEQAANKPTASRKKEVDFLDRPIVKQAGRTATNIIVRSLLGALGVSSTRSRKKSWF
jgi:hypothetical protein